MEIETLQDLMRVRQDVIQGIRSLDIIVTALTLIVIKSQKFRIV